MSKKISTVLLSSALLVLSACQSLSPFGTGRDDDADGVSNLFDVDDDGDGLIELDNAMDLSSMCFVPDGSGFKSSPSAATNKRGCGDGCRGYELRADIDLRRASSCISIGNHFIHEEQFRVGRPFSAILDGNGHVIRNLRIEESLFRSRHHGLFAFTKGATIRNLHIRNVNIRAGKAAGALIGFAEHTDIIATSVSHSSIIGQEASGGLVGYGDNTRIHSSYARDSRISSSDNAGGLIGSGKRVSIRTSYALNNSIDGNGKVGGLAGNGDAVTISASYSAARELKGRIDVGGLIGFASGGAIRFSYAANRDLGSRDAGGLIGQWGERPDLLFSYWDANTSAASDNGYGVPHPTADLTGPTDFSGIYAAWLEGEPELIWCDKDGNGRVEEDEQTDDNRIWFMGAENQYPSIQCIQPHD